MAAGVLIAASQLVRVAVTWFIARRAWRRQPGGGLVVGVSMPSACTGAVTATEARGTSFCDVVLDTMPLLAALLLLRWSESSTPGRRDLAAIGLQVGMVVAIKPTGLFLLPALGAVTFLPVRGRSGVRALAADLGAVAAGLLCGALFLDGFWGVLPWRSYGSPMFPFMNDVFRSPSAAPIDFANPSYHWRGRRTRCCRC